MKPQHWKPPDISNLMWVERSCLRTSSKESHGTMKCCRRPWLAGFPEKSLSEIFFKDSISLGKRLEFSWKLQKLRSNPIDWTQIDNKMKVSVCPVGCLGGLVLGFDRFVISYMINWTDLISFSAVLIMVITKDELNLWRGDVLQFQHIRCVNPVTINLNLNWISK